jgi:hypothetical protein
MSNKTKQIFILSLVVSIITVGTLAFFLYKIKVQGDRLEEQTEILKENTKKENAYINLKRLAQETEADRNLLAASFFKEEGDSIVFLGETESLASSLGLSLEIDALDKVIDEETKQEHIKVTLIYVGQKDLVFNFSKLMEVAPYHSKVESLTLSQLPGNDWEGKLTISITINPL